MNRRSTSTRVGRGNGAGSAVAIRRARGAVNWRVGGSFVGRGRNAESRAHVGSVVAADEGANVALEVADSRSLTRSDVGKALALGHVHITETEAVLDAAHISAVVGVDRAVYVRTDFVVEAIGFAVGGSFESCARARGSRRAACSGR